MTTLTATAPENGDEATVELAKIAHAMTRWRLLIGRRIIGRTVIDKAAPDLDLSHLDVIEVVKRGEGEVTVGAIAEAMRVDPSRSSRLVAELVQGGMLKRAVSQQDARRSVVHLTEKSRAMIAEVQVVKRELIESCLEGWSDEEIGQFSVLFERFVSGFENYARKRDFKSNDG